MIRRELKPLPPFFSHRSLLNQLVIVGPFTNEEVTTYEISALKITINKTDKVSHVGMGASSSQDSQPTDPVTTFMEHLAKHPEVVQVVLEKLQEIKASHGDTATDQSRSAP